MIKSMIKTRIIIAASAAIVAGFGCLLYGTFHLVVLMYIAMDALFTLIFIPRILPGGLRYIAIYIITSIAWLGGAWLLAPWITDRLT